MTTPKIGIIVGSTRRNRFADQPAAWIRDLMSARDDLEFEVVDLRDYPLPFFEDRAAPAYGALKGEAAHAWAARLATFDGFILLVAEYNHGPTAVLKNALDHAFGEFNRKPVTFIGYGGVGGARAVEQLRLVAVELEMAPLRNAVHIGVEAMLGVVRGGKSLADFPYLGERALAMLEELSWWSRALKVARQAAPATAA